MELLLALPVLFFSVVVHECAHGLMALKAGDPTAKLLGRITLNPLPHIDLWGTVLVPLFLVLARSPFFIGWAKPVPINPLNFQNPRWDELRVALVGPLSNLGLAVIFTVLTILAGLIFSQLPGALGFWPTLYQVGWYAISINVLLAIFNLIPIPPLDGSHILRNLLPPEAAEGYRRLQPYGFLVLILLILTPIFDYLLMPAHFLARFLFSVVEMVL